MNMSQLYFIFLSGFPNQYNGAEGIHDFGDFCKYGHVRQAKGGTGESPVRQLSVTLIPRLASSQLRICYHFRKVNSYTWRN